MPSPIRQFHLSFIGLFTCCILSINTYSNHLGFGFDNEKKSVSIPFKSFNNLIIVESVLDGKNKLNLILDTGIRSLVLFDQSSLPAMSSNTFDLSFTGAGDLKPIEAKVSVNHNLRLSEDVVANQINAVILKKSNRYLHKLKGIKVHGAFGYQLFSRFQVRIDYKNEIITLTEPFESSCVNGYESIPITIHDTKPFIDTRLMTKKNRPKKMNMLLDLGANHKILLHDNFNDKNLHDLTYNERIAEGLAGPIFGKKGFSEQFFLGNIQFENVEVLIPSTNSYVDESSKTFKKHGSIGGKLFQNSTIIVDYINGYLFIKNNISKSITS